MTRIELPRTLVTRILQHIQRNAGTTKQGHFTTATIPAGAWHAHEHTEQIPDKKTVQQAGDLYLGIYLGTQGVLQMRGWRLENGEVQSVEIGIRENLR